MKISRTREKICLHLAKREKLLFFELLKLYPCIPSAHQQLTQHANLADQESNQRMLDEALAEQRLENKKQVQSLLNDPKRIEQNQTGCRFSLSPSEVEWLLQVLNDIRVGSWVLLGSPEEKFDVSSLTEATARHVWAMEMSGLFQMHLLEALERDA